MQRRPAGQHKGSRPKSQQTSSAVGRVRIIAGRWRGSQLPVPDLIGLRPSGDRVRETLFNWLQAWIPGAQCVDLFAGSGALGFEAASRGADTVVLIDSQRQAVESLQASRDRLKATEVEVVHDDALLWMQRCCEPFDIIFVDPPFGHDLQQRALDLIQARGLLKSGGLLYLELPIGSTVEVSPDLVLGKEKTIGDVQLCLYRVA
jgi:16S rRNA (guanine966-N2)-methyltransferase